MAACSPAFNPLVLEKNMNCGGPSMFQRPSVDVIEESVSHVQHTRGIRIELYFPEVKIEKTPLCETVLRCMFVRIDKLDCIDEKTVKERRLHCGCWFRDWIDQMLTMRAMQALDWVSLCANGIASLSVLNVWMKHSVFLLQPLIRLCE